MLGGFQANAASPDEVFGKDTVAWMATVPEPRPVSRICDIGVMLMARRLPTVALVAGNGGLRAVHATAPTDHKGLA